MSEKPPVKWQIYTAADPTVLRIIPELAAEIGLNESIVLMQIAFWIKTSNNVRDGIYWTYQSMAEMKEKAFPYWSVDTIRRIIHKLETDGYIVIGQHNKRKGDNTQWYALEPDKLSSLTSVIVGPVEKETSTPYSQDASTPYSQVASTPLQDRTTLPEITTESKEKDSAPNGSGKILTLDDEPKPSTKAKRKEDPLFEAIATVWETRAGGFVSGIKTMMIGKATGNNQYAKGNFDEPVTDPNEILRFGEWCKPEMKRKNMLKMPTYAVTIQKWFYDFRADEQRKANRKDTDYVPVGERTSALDGVKLVS